MPGPDPAPLLPLRPLVLAGAAISALTLGGVAAFGSVATLQGAVAARGIVVVESSAKRVQHPDGGVVEAILARNGDSVREGEVLLRLDATQLRAGLSIVEKQLAQLTARRARLEAERDSRSMGGEPFKDQTVDDLETPFTEAWRIESALFRARADSQEGQRSLLRQRISEIRQAITGLELEITSLTRQRAIAERELAGVRTLFEKRILPLTRLLALEREIAAVDGRRGERQAALARAYEQIGQAELEQSQRDKDLRAEVLGDLAETERRIAELTERRTQASDRLGRVEIRAPAAGVVDALAVHTIGGVVRAGETLMLVVPRQDRLVVEASVAPPDVDRVFTGQAAFVRLTNFNRRTTPELDARVIHLSADVVAHPRTGEMHYTVRLAIADDALDRVDGLALLPGMQVEAFLATGERTLLSYLTKPLTDSFAHAMRER